MPAVLQAILEDDSVSPAYRLRAAEIILDRVVCKAEVLAKMQQEEHKEIAVHMSGGVEELSK